MIRTKSRIVEVGDLIALELERPKLLIETGPEEGAEHHLPEHPLVLGRGDEADLVLGDGTISRTHARLQPWKDGWRIQDLESKDGTWVDGVRIEAAMLAEGSRIRLGETELIFCMGRTRLAEEHDGEEPAVLDGYLGSSESFRRVLKLAKRVAPVDLPVLVTGESGTGKEKLAEAIHRLGPTPDGPYQVVDCTLLSPEHLRSELFGHVKGAFTGADRDRAGAFAAADGGTVFLDEIGELPVELQPTLLRIIEQGEVRPLGSDRNVKVRTRIVTATNRNLEAMAEEGSFRRDLFYRLSAVTLELPPLRERPGDAELLAESFLEPGCTLTSEARAAIAAHPWPGNVRQLRNALRRACALAEGGVIGVPDLGITAGAGGAGEAAGAASAAGKESSLDQSRSQHELARIHEALGRFDGNRTLAAEYLGITRVTLWRKLKKLEAEGGEAGDGE